MNKSTISKLFAVVAFGLSALSAWAVKPEAGNVYRIRNIGYDKVVSDNGPSAVIGCSTLNTSNNSQLWLAEATNTEGALTFRSLGTGLYMRSSNARSTGWTLSTQATSNNCKIIVTANGSDFNMWCVGGGAGVAAHCDGSSNIVGWDASINPSKWNFDKVEMTQAAIDAALAANASMMEETKKEAEYQTALSALFSDKACTTLKPEYASKTVAEIKNDANYKKLPASLQKMIEKTISKDWSETYANGVQWDSEHAKKFRIQSYEPYGSGNDVAQLAGIQAYTNMNNPTGILSDNGSVLYVMVDKAPADGSQIFINGVAGSGFSSLNDPYAGTELHEGLNILPGWTDNSHQFIFYTVSTVNWENGKAVRSEYKVTEFDPITIHIEGGELNGFFDYRGDELYKADTNDDYIYYRDRARHEMFDFVGQYVILHLFFPDTPWKVGNNPGQCVKSLYHAGNRNEWDMVKTIDAWDEMCYNERMVMGLQSDDDILNNPRTLAPYLYEGAPEGKKVNPYEPLTGDDIAPSDLYQYFNNKMLAVNMQGDLFMNATSWRTAYNGSTIPSLLGDFTTNSGSLWGPAHEYGHMNQAPMKVAGTTEISNNVFSNVAVFYQGISTSRSDNMATQLEKFNQDVTYLEHSTWGTTRMYLQLWLYYHVAGHNKKFYPRLYQLLRENPLQKSYYLNMRYDQLHFAKMCCIAAGEDLTNYFESWGFFTVLDNYHIGDYSNFMATLTQQDADAVKAEIKALNLPVNNQIILIDDRVGSTRRSWADYMSIEDAGCMGGVKDFTEGCQPSGTLSFNISGFNVEVDSVAGKGGIGFLIFDQDGTLLGFSNDYSFPINSKAAAALIGGTAKVVAMGSDGTQVEVTNNFANSNATARLDELKKLIATVEPEIAKIDATNTQIGYFMEYYAKPLVKVTDEAKAMTESNTAEEITEAYLNLINEYNALMHHDFATVRLVPGGTYGIISRDWDKRALGYSERKGNVLYNTQSKYVGNDYVNSSGEKIIATWVLETVDADANQYRLKVNGTSLYIVADDGENTTAKNTTPKLGKKSKAAVFTVKETSRGEYIFCQNMDERFSLHINTNGNSQAVNPIVTDGSWNGSKWTLKLVNGGGRGGAQVNLKQLIDETNSKLPEAGSVTLKADPITLKSENISSNAYYTGDNEGDRFTSFEVLLDGDTKTHFHSDYSNSAPASNHRLDIDLGEGNETRSFQVVWTTRNLDNSNANTNAPVTVKVAGSNDGNKFTNITTLSDCPTGSAVSYLSKLIESEEPYRYIRLTVTATSTGQACFVMSELGINNAHMEVQTNAQYPAVTEQLLLDLDAALANAEATLSSSNGNPSEAKCDNAFNELYPLYVQLCEALGEEAFVMSSIEEIEDVVMPGSQAYEGIYDLQGHRYSEIPGPGIYIVNGKKMLVK